MRKLVVAVVAMSLLDMSYAVTLTRDGAPAATVVIPGSPRPVEKFAAEELVRFVKRASGAELKIATKPVAGMDQVLIGRAAGLSGLEPFCGTVHANGKVLKIAGGDDDEPLKSRFTKCGTLFAVYEFLERELGVLWLWPDEELGVVVRTKKTIEIPDGSYGFRRAFDSSVLRRLPIPWQRRVARAHGYPRPMVFPPALSGGHVFGKWWKTYGKTNPDFFEMDANGKRVIGGSSSMCVSNPKFHDELFRLWNEARQKEPGVIYDLNLCENDTAGRCKCPKCMEWSGANANDVFKQYPKWYKADADNVSERYTRWYKTMADRMSAVEPEARIYAFAYKNYYHPPKGFKLSPNIHIGFVPRPHVPYTAEWRKLVHECARGWRESGCTFNYRPNIFDGYVMPEDVSDDIYDEFHQVYAGNMKAIDVDGPNMSFATQGPFLYMLSRLCAKPDAKLEDLRAEYFSGFGPAADAVRDYFEYWRRYTLGNAEKFCRTPVEKDPISHCMFFGFHYAFYAHLLYPQEVFKTARALMEKALAAAKSSPDDLKRVEFLSAGLEHAALCAKTCEVFADAKADNAAKLSAVDAVRAFREKRLPNWAADLKIATSRGWNESAAWVFPALDSTRSFALPIDWKFMLDTADEGERRGYFKADFDDSGWGTAKTDRHLERQGYNQGWLHAWFRVEVEIPKRFRGSENTILHFGALDKSCKLWINGRLAGSFTYNPETHPGSWQMPMEFDITRLVPADGKLNIAVQVTSLVGSGGIVKPCYLVFPSSSQLRYVVSPQNPPAKGAYYSYRDVCCEWTSEGFAFNGSESGSTGVLRLDALSSPAQKKLVVSVDYRQKGGGEVILSVEEKDVRGKKLRRTPIALKPTPDFSLNEAEIETLADTAKLLLFIENKLDVGAHGMARCAAFELKPLLTK